MLVGLREPVVGERFRYRTCRQVSLQLSDGAAVADPAASVGARLMAEVTGHSTRSRRCDGICRARGIGAGDVLAYFERPGTSNGPTEAINGRLEHLRGSALGFRNLTNYVARSLLEAGGFRPRLHPDCEEPV